MKLPGTGYADAEQDQELRNFVGVLLINIPSNWIPQLHRLVSVELFLFPHFVCITMYKNGHLQKENKYSSL